MFRPYRPRDADELIRVWLASTIPGQPFLSEEFWRSQEPLLRETYLPIAKSWVIEEEGEMVAFLSMLDDLIAGLFTHPDHQGKGHGARLVEHARTLFDPVFVEVFEANEAARRFYRRCGFVAHERKLDEHTGLPLLILRIPGR